jgi:hypothetical protein
MTLLQSQSPSAVLQLLGTEYAAQLAKCEDCTGSAQLIVTPDPCFGNQPNADAGWIGYYAVRCPQCRIHFPGDMSASAGGHLEPATLEEHRTALQSAVDSWNSVVAIAA